MYIMKKSKSQIFREILERHEVPIPSEEEVEEYLADVREPTADMLVSDVSDLGISDEMQCDDLMQHFIEVKARAYMVQSGYLQVAGLGWSRRHVATLAGTVALVVTIPTSVAMVFAPWSYWWAGFLPIGLNLLQIGGAILHNKRK